MKDSKLKWHAAQVDAFKSVRSGYEQYAAFLDEVLRRACKQLAPLAIVQYRAKTIPSFAEKILRKMPPVQDETELNSVKKWQDHFDPINKFTDLCGARVITQTEYEVSRVCSFIQNNFIIDKENSEDKKSGLKPDQFNYLSVHYIVSVEEGAELLGVKAPPGIAGLKAEIQVRTLLQHAWASISHDSLYKINMRPPARVKRDLARVAAVLEAADKEFASFVEDMKAYTGQYGAHLDDEELQQELSLLDILLDVEKDDDKRLPIIMQKVRLYKCMSLWDKVQQLLQSYEKGRRPEVLRELGHAMCRINGLTPNSAEYEQGLQFLQSAVNADSSDAEAFYYLALAFQPHNAKKAKENFRKAHELRPTDPYFLASFLEHHITSKSSEAIMGLMGPTTEAAVNICRAHAEAEIELPWCLFTMGRLHLIQNQPYRCLHAYLEAVNLWIADENIALEPIDEEIATLQRLGAADVAGSLEAHSWALRLLTAAKAARLVRESGRMAASLADARVKMSSLKLEWSDDAELGSRLKDQLNFLDAQLDQTKEPPQAKECTDKQAPALLAQMKDEVGRVTELVDGQMDKLWELKDQLAQEKDNPAEEPVEPADIGKELADLLESLAENPSRFVPMEASLAGLQAAAVQMLAELASDKVISRTPKGEVTTDRMKLEGPIVLLAGSCLGQEQEVVDQYMQDLLEALPDFKGTIVSGGTKAGVAGLAGWLQTKLDGDVVTYGYLPTSLPRGASEDQRYKNIVLTDGKEFSPLQPLQMWLDILHDGVPVDNVNLLAIGGGRIAAVEYRLALAMGAKVGVLQGSGRAADALLEDPIWGGHRNLIRLVLDPMTIRALLLCPSLRLSKEQIETAARTSHEANRTKKKAEDVEPSMKPWPKLDQKFKHSSRQQKIYAEAILNRFGYGLRPWPEDVPKDEDHLFQYPSEIEVREMARMEHGRWNVERIQEGWVHGEVKDVDKKTTPYLVPWGKLDDKVKQYDIDYVLGWPEDFQKADFEIYKLSEDEKDDE